MKKFKNKKFILILILFLLAVLAIFFFKPQEEKTPDQILYNVSTNKRIEFVKDPDYYDESDILTLLDKKTLELSSDNDEKAHTKLVFTSDDGDFEGEFLDKKKGREIYSNFKGKFEVVEKLDKFTYKLDVSQIELRDSGFSNLDKDEDQLIYVFPNHFRKKNEFILRLPNTKTYNLIDGYEKYDFQNVITDTLNVFSLETGGYVYYEKVYRK